jgi:hypothetical protein
MRMAGVLEELEVVGTPFTEGCSDDLLRLPVEQYLRL